MRFYKEFERDKCPEDFISGTFRWYVDLPNYRGNKSDLELVYGADTLLDELMVYQGYNSEVYVIVYDSDVLDLYDIILFKTKEYDIEDLDNEEFICGASYSVDRLNRDINISVENIWLCPVVQNIFGKYPNNIYLKLKK